MNILIFTTECDQHSLIMRSALADHGVKVMLLLDEKFPGELTIEIGPENTVLRLDDLELDITKTLFWNRRIGQPQHASGMDAADADVVFNYNQKFLRELRTLQPDIWSPLGFINDDASQHIYKSKINQLRLARKVGFLVPKTIITNNSAALESFRKDHGAIIVKPLYPIVWPDGSAMPASIMCESERNSESSVRQCPMIYQELVDKIFEIRAVVFGGNIIAVKIDPNGQKLSADWRENNFEGFEIEVFSLPSDVSGLIKGFCSKANLSHCSIDLAVSRNGEYFFLEVNVQGQWMWLEILNPNVRLLEAFVSFVCDLLYIPLAQNVDIKLLDYMLPTKISR